MSIALGGCLKAPPIALGLTEDTGGHLTYLWGAAEALARRSDVTGVELVTRLFRDDNLGAVYARPHETVAPGIVITRVETGDDRYLSKEDAARDRPAFIAALIALLEKRAALPDIVHAHFADAAEVAIALRDRFGIPFIYTAHSLAIDKRSCGLGGGAIDRRIAMENRAIGAADAIIASSRDEAERQLMAYPAADAATIHRVAPGAVLPVAGPPRIDEARALVAPFLRDPARPMLLAIARPVHKKNLAALVDLYAGCPVLRESANLVIVAGLRDDPHSGEEEQQAVIAGLIERMDRHDLYGRMALPKRHDQSDVQALYALAAQTHGVFVNPALNEPYGLTLTEAAHHGLPVVATDRGGAGDIVRLLRHGATANPGDPAAFAREIVRLIEDRAHWQAAAEAGRVNSRMLNWDAYAEAFRTIAASATGRPATRAERRAPDLLLLSDIDNTLTGCRDGAGELVSRLGATPQIGFGIATGRSLQEARRILSEWRYPSPRVWVTSVGSEIYWRDGDRLRADPGFAAHIAYGWEPQAVDRIVDALPGLERQPDVEQRRFKRSWFAAGPGDAHRARAALAEAGIGCRVIFSHDRLLDVLPERAGKSAAMQWVARVMGLPLSAVIAAGDSGNDLDMLTACPNAILVANHSDELRDLRHKRGVHVARRSHAGAIVEYIDLRLGTAAMETAA